MDCTNINYLSINYCLTQILTIQYELYNVDYLSINYCLAHLSRRASSSVVDASC